MKRLALFPDTTRIENDALTIAGLDLARLAEEFGTPLYLYDRQTMDNAVAAYRSALAQAYPAPGGFTYAGKAFLCLAIAEWTGEHGLWVDCTGLGEIAIAAAAGVPPERLLVHGVNKSAADLEAACDHAGVIVVDNLAELQRLADLSRRRPVPQVWLRFQPGLAVATHAYTQTGHSDSKFGMDAQQLMEAAHLCRKDGLALTGLHFHQGSQFRDPAPLETGILRALELANELGFNGDWTLSPGGGWGVAYHEDDLPQPDITEYIRVLSAAVVKGCRENRLPLPCLRMEPGRSLVARAGVALYRVGAVKRTATRTWVLMDGGLADNPRPALYGARYTALPVRGPERPADIPTWLAGPYCESGDVLIEGLPMPEVHEGDLIAVPVSGAYQLSMSGNYNGARRPAVLWLDGGQAQIIQRREAPQDLLRRDRRLAAKDRRLVKPARKG
jgi:diaminopimelate decarboxylase